MKFDIIIPFKDSMNFLPGICSDLNNQSDLNFNVYFVSDHCEDNSIVFLNDSVFRFKYEILYSSGEGPGSARNHGVKKSTSDYILFIDADDRICKDYVSEFKHKACENHSDIIECMYRSVNEEGQVISGTKIEDYVSGSNRFLSLLLGELPRLSWGKAYKRSYLSKENVTFPEGVHNGEDHIFLLQAYKHSPRIDLLYKRLYSWVRYKTSLTNRPVNKKTIEDFINVSIMKDEMISSYVMEGDFNYLLFSRRVFKEARALKNKILNDGQADSVELIEFLKSLIIDDDRFANISMSIKYDADTDYWNDIFG